MATKKTPPRNATLDDLLSAGLRYAPLDDTPAPAAAEPAQGSGFFRRAADYGLTAVKGAIAVPEAAVGMADLVTGGRVGKFLENEGGAIGFRPQEARAFIDQGYSSEQQAANQQVQRAEGAIDTTMAALRNPSVIAHSVVESLPLMAGGGVIARALVKGGAAIAGPAGPLRPGVLARMAGADAAPIIAGATGEGIASAGSSAEQIRQQSSDRLLTNQQAALSVGSGALTSLLGALGGRVAQRLGIADVDTLFAGKAAPEATKGFVRRVLEGAFSEGILEELPQSIQEQVAQNLALDRPLDEGVDQAAVLGALAGGVMGGGGQFFARSPGDEIRQHKLPAAGPMTRAVNAPIEEAAKAADAAPPVPPAAPPGAEAAQAGVTAMLDEERRRAASEARGEELFNQTYPGVAAAPAAEPAMPVPPLRPDALDQLDRMRAADEASLRVYEPTVSEAQPEPGDLLNPKDEPFRNKRAAVQAQKKAGEGFDVVPVAGGYVVRKKKEAVDGGQPVEAAGLAAPAAGGGGDDAGRGAGDLGGVAADDGRPVAAAAAEPVAGGEPTAPVGDAGEPDAALTREPTVDAMRKAVERVGEARFQRYVADKLADLGELSDEERAAEIEGVARDINDGAYDADALPQEASTDDPELDAAAHAAATSHLNGLPTPTPAQLEAGNYQKGHYRLKSIGLPISIETAKGAERRAKDGSWVVPQMPAHYGDINRTEGADGDPVDLFIGDRGDNGRFWVINQNTPDGKDFDEHKVVTGVDSADEAVAIYKASFTDGFGDKVFGSISAEHDPDALKALLPKLKKAKAVKPAAEPSPPAEAQQGEPDGQEGLQGRRQEALTPPIASATAAQPEVDAVPAAQPAAEAPSRELVAGDAMTKLNATMRRAGWEIDYVDLDLTGEKPQATIRLNRNDGRWVFARVDGLGRASFESFQRNKSLGIVKNNPQARVAPLVDDVFLGRQKFDGARSMLRGMVNYLVDNATGTASVEDMRAAWAGVMAAPTRFDALEAPKSEPAQDQAVTTAAGPAEPQATPAPAPKPAPTIAEQAETLRRMEEEGKAKKAEPAPTAAPATHADPGQPAEPATPAVVAEAITKAARKKDEPVADIRAEALRLIDMAIANAPDDKIEVSTSEPRTSNGKTEFTAFKGKAGTDDYISVEVREANDGNWTMHAHEGARSVMVHQFKGGSTAAARRSAESIMLGAAKEGTKTVIQPADKVTIKVPGDGAFTVVNNADRLREFRKVVERSPGFAASKKAKPRIEKAVSSGDLSPNSLAREMLDEGEPLNALEVMDAAGKPMAFGNGGDTGQIPYTDVRDETIDGDAGFFSGHSWSAKKGESRWAVLDKTSGLSLGSGVSRDAALSVAKSNIKKAGAIDKITLARQNPKNKSQQQLRAEFQAEAERKQAATFEAQDRVIAAQAAYNAKLRENEAFYKSIMGEDAKLPLAASGGTAWRPEDVRAFLSAAEKAGKAGKAEEFIRDVLPEGALSGWGEKLIGDWKKAGTVAELTVGYSTVKTGKPPYLMTWDEIEPSVVAQTYVPRGTQQRDATLNQWRMAHFEAVKEAQSRGWAIPDQVLYDNSTLIRSDLDADAADLASDAMVATYQRTKDYAQAVQAYRDWAPGVDAKGFTVVKGKGGFTLESDDIPDILVYKTKTWDGKDRYQARLKNTTNESGPNLTEQQAIDWAANLRDDMRKAAPAAAPAPAPAAQSSAPAPAPQAPEAPKAQEGAEPAAAPAEAKAEGAPAAAKVENFGEALPPARRNMAAKLDESLSDDDIAKRPFSEIWPLAENEAIEDTFAAAVAHAARAEVPAKPRVAYKLKRWVEAVKTVRELAGMIVSGRTSKAQMADMIVGERATKRSLRDWWSKVLLLEQTPREQWSRIETVEEHPNAISYADGKQVEASHLSVRVDGRSHWLTGDAGVEGKARGTVAGNMDGIRKLLADAEPEKRMKFEIRQNKTTGVIFVNKVGDPESRHLMEFTDAKEARKAINEQYDALVAAWDAVKARDNVTERDLRSAENRPRVGKDHRGGKDVTVEQFAERFGFRGGEFGKWVEQGKGDKERQAILNSAYDALMDLSDILNIPPRAISLNGTLGIAFGSRGSGWASAHFEPSNLVINLTKTRGAGALGHEWFHALDNYFSRLRRDGEGTKFDGDKRKYRDENYITHRPEALMVRKDRSRYFPPMTKSALEAMHERRKHQTDNYAPEKWERDPSAPAQVRPEVEARFAALVEALNDSPMTLRSKALDKGGSGYWASTLERAARAFENYLQARMQEQGYHNDFLANVVPVDDPSYKRSPERYPYLMAGEVKPIAEAFDALFAEVKTRETDSGNVAMFSRTAAAGPGLDLETGRRLAAAFGQAGLVRINVAASADALPSNRRRLQVIGATNVRGAYFPSSDDIWVMADRVHSPEEFAFVALHEAFHRGLRKTVPDAAPLLRQMYRTNEALRERVQRVQASLKIGRDEAIEEALADMAGEGKARDLSGWDKLLKLIRGWLAKITDALGVDLTFTDDMIETFVAGVAGEGLKRAPPALPAGAVVHSRVAQTDTPEFKRWFGDSKVVDANGKPLVVYHGTGQAMRGDAFDPELAKSEGGAFYFSHSPLMKNPATNANDYAANRSGDSPNVMPVYLRMSNPLVVGFTEPMPEGDAAIAAWLDRMQKFNRSIDMTKERYYRNAIRQAKAGGHDGVIVRNVEDVANDAGRRFTDEADVYIAFQPEQIKSAIGNRGTFDPDNADIRLSRVAEAVGDAFNDVRDVRLPAGYMVGDLFNGVGKLHWWHKSVGTMHNLAQRSPLFRRVYDAVQSFLGDVSLYATEAADQAPTILPKLETWRDLGKSPLSAADTKAIAAPIFEGTLTWARDENGRPVKVADLEEAAQGLSAMDKARSLMRAGKLTERVLKMWQGLPLDQFEAILHSKYERDMLAPGVVWSDGELRRMFHLDDRQVALYREFRKATDLSLKNLAVSDMIRFGGEDVAAARDKALAAESADDAAIVLRDHLFEMAESDPARAALLNDTGNKIIGKADRANDLMKRGYAPLSRFGSHTVYVVDQGEQVYFGMFETSREAARMARQMREQFPDAQIQRGTVSQEEFKLFAGVSPETLALFGEMLGLEQQGDDAASQAFQTYLKLAKNNRSAMKRLIHRKGIAGFNEDVGRVLAGFVYSNARQTASNLHMGEITAAASEIPKGQGELKDAAVRLADYIKNPQEEAQAVRGVLFAQFLGGSVASAMVNLTQPLAVTFPYLSQHLGAKGAAAQVARALADVGKKDTGDAALDSALRKAEEEGIVSPQEVHQLMAQARGRATLRAGDGTAAGDAAAAASNALSRLSIAWGKVFGLAEQINRRATFIAAYRTAVERGMDDPAAFAKQAVNDTQFVYGKGAKPAWARGAVGSVLFTFKTYSISYVELVNRLWQSGPEGKKAALLMMAMLFLMGGADGLPFADDANDVIDGVLQRLGYNFSTKAAKREFFARVLGEDLGRVAEKGLTGLPGVPIDLSGRLGMGNLIPGTGMLVKKADHTRDVAELAGPVADLGKRGFQAAGQLLDGDPLKAAATMSPVAARNVVKAIDMASTGMYRDDRGRKVIDVDGYDAVMKGLGFQPTDVSRVQAATSLTQQLIAQNKVRESEIADLWARGMFEGDQDLVQEAREALAQWNRTNPSTPIKIDRQQIRKRVAQMRASKTERLAKTAPKEIRAEVRRELEAAR